MLLIKSKYKIAKRLGASVFEKTQSEKFALSDARAKKSKKSRRGGSDYGRQLLEKQKLRYIYGLSEKQLSKYAHDAFTKDDPSASLHQALEMRADSVVYNTGLASTRRAGRQMVSHGHIIINGHRTNVPSHRIRVGDVISVREGSRTSVLFAGLSDTESDARRAIPKWISFDAALLKAEVVGEAEYRHTEGGLDYATVFEFYSR